MATGNEGKVPANALQALAPDEVLEEFVRGLVNALVVAVVKRYGSAEGNA